MLKSFDFQALRSLKDKANDANYLPKKKDAENIEYSSICLNIINLVTWRDIMTQIDFTNFKPNNLYFLPLQYIEKNIKMASLSTFCFTMIQAVHVKLPKPIQCLASQKELATCLFVSIMELVVNKIT